MKGKDCEENFLNQKMMSLEHHADLLMMSNEDEKKQRNEAEDKIRCLETEISNLNYKFGACNAELEKNLK